MAYKKRLMRTHPPYSEDLQKLNGEVKTLQGTVNNPKTVMNALGDDLNDSKDENLNLRKRMYEAESKNRRFLGLEEEGQRRNIIIDGLKEAPQNWEWN